MRLHFNTAAVDRLGKGHMPKQIKNNLVATILCIALAVAIAGCGSERPVKYYQLTYPPVPATPAQESFNIGLLVRLFQTSHLYREDRIIYGNDSPEMGAYEDHRWAEPPSEMLQDALVRGLRSSGRFSLVNTLRSNSAGDYILTGHLYEFKELTGGTLAARVSYDAELREIKSGKSVWNFTYNHDEPVNGSDVTAVVTAMDKNVQMSVQAVLGGITEYFHSHPVK
jgi:ABC-type uncharacterized transport system auxiliary subunit